MNTELPKWQNNSVNKARRHRGTKRIIGFCYRAAHRGEAAIFYGDGSFTRFCEANKKAKQGGVVNDDCRGCRVKGVPVNVIIEKMAA